MSAKPKTENKESSHRGLLGGLPVVGQLLGVNSIRDIILIEDDVVRERLVVDEFNSFALGDRDGRREETEFTIVATQLDGGSKRRVDHKDSRANDGSLLIVKIEKNWSVVTHF